MSLREVLNNRQLPRRAPVLPDTVALDAAVRRVNQRWPEVNPSGDEESHEIILAKLLKHLNDDDWTDVKMSFVVLALRTAFLQKFNGRKDVNEIIEFAYLELSDTSKSSLVNACMKIYTESFSDKSEPIKKLGEILNNKERLYNYRWKSIVSNFPNYLKPNKVADDISSFMENVENVWISLKKVGISDPLAGGVMDYAHINYIQKIAPNLDTQKNLEKLFEWLIPEQNKIQRRGAKVVIEAILKPWLITRPDDEMSQYITESLISLYGDPRIRKKNWESVEKKYLNLFISWLTKEELLFFTEILSSTQKSHMWQPRRDFWLKLYNEGEIDQAWVAFCPEAEQYARKPGSKSRLGVSENRFGIQSGRPNTSVLIMKIRNKIFVDGCHSYKTHVWDITDPTAPPLFKKKYDCDRDLRLLSPTGGKTHWPIHTWEEWVRRQIFAKVSYSNRKPINWDDPRRNFINYKG